MKPADNMSDQDRVLVSQLYSQILQSFTEQSADVIINNCETQLDQFDRGQLQALSDRLPDMVPQISSQLEVPMLELDIDIDDTDIESQLNLLDNNDTPHGIELDKLFQIQQHINQRLSQIVDTKAPSLSASRVSSLAGMSTNNHLPLLLAGSIIAYCARRLVCRKPNAVKKHRPGPPLK